MNVRIYNFKDEMKRQMRILRPKCDRCEKQAEYNFQEVFITYRLEDTETGFDYIEEDAVVCGENLFYCRECAVWEGYL